MPLSESAQQLIPKARIISFADWPYQQAAIAIWQQADNHTRYLDDRDLDTIVNLEPDLLVSSQQARKLRDNATFIVDNARAMISGLEALKQYS
ncbi:MAG: phycobilisome protein, partial [Microcystis sp.]